MAANRAASNKFRQTYSSNVIGYSRPAARRREWCWRWSIDDPGHIDRMAFKPPRSHAGVLGAVNTRPSDDVVPHPAGKSAALPNGPGAAYDASESALGAVVPAARNSDMGGGEGSTEGPRSASTVLEAAPTRSSGEDCVVRMPGGGGPTDTDESARACACLATSAAGHASLRRRRRGWKAGPPGVAAEARPGLNGWAYAREAGVPS